MKLGVIGEAVKKLTDQGVNDEDARNFVRLGRIAIDNPLEDYEMRLLREISERIRLVLNAEKNMHKSLEEHEDHRDPDADLQAL